MKYEIIYLVKGFKHYDYRETLPEAIKFAETVDAVKIMKGRKTIKDFKNKKSKKYSFDDFLKEFG